MGIQSACITPKKETVYHANSSDIDTYVKRMKRISPVPSKKVERSFLNASIRYMVLENNAKANNGKCKCVLCGRTIDDNVTFHVDHILAIANGGKTEMQNLQVLCSECNLGKGARII